MAVLNVSQKSFEIVLVFGSAFVLFALERGVFDIGAAMFAPILGLF